MKSTWQQFSKLAATCLAVGWSTSLLSATETIQFWQTMNNEETATLEKQIEAFEKKFPKYKVELQTVPFSDAQNKFKIAAQAGSGPDVFRAEIAWIPELAHLNIIEPLDGLLKPEFSGDFLETPMAYGKVLDKTWSVPQVTDCLALLYNKDLFAKAGVKVPATMEELVTVGKKLTSGDQYGLGLHPDSYWAQPFIWAFGGELIDSSTREVKINQDASIAGLQFMVDLVRKHNITPKNLDFVNGYNNMMTGFKQGRYAMILNGPWSTSDILAGPAFKDKKNLGIARIPKGPAGYGSPVGGHNWVIRRGTKVKAAAWELIQFLSESKNQAEFANSHNLLPTRKSAWNLPEVKNNPMISDFQAQIEVANIRPVIPESGQIYTAFTPAVQDALSGKKTPKKALKKVARSWKKLLKRRNRG